MPAADAPGRPPGGPLPPIPLTVLTGFLGAGKTTLLNRLLRDPALADTVVIVNEFGEVGIDHLLVEHAEDGLVLLSAGCLCCTVRGDLVTTLEDLLRRRDNGRITPFRRVLIETTGLADPAPVLAAVLYHPYLSRRYAVSGVVTAVDAVHGAGALARHEEARRQVAVADLIALTKTDLPEVRRGSTDVVDAIRRLAPNAPIRKAAEIGAAEIVEGGLFGPDGKIGDVAGWLRAESDRHEHAHDHSGHRHGHERNRHDARIQAVILLSGTPLASTSLDTFLELLRASFGPRLLRLKGLVELKEQPGRPVVLHGVQHVLHVPGSLPAWPDDDHRSRLVLIVEDVPPEAIRRLWSAFSGEPGVDLPDAAALADNPLAPATLRSA